MTSTQESMRVGMRVLSSDEKALGTVRRIWYPDGRVEPPDSVDPGLVQLETLDRGDTADLGYFEVDRFLAPDWYVPFAAVRNVVDSHILLDVSEDDAERFAWQKRPS
jgi:hypothetical protein